MTQLHASQLVHPMIQQYIKENPAEFSGYIAEWDYLAKISRQIMMGLTLPRPILALMKEKPLLKFLPDIRLFHARLMQLETDLKVMRAEYEEVANAHAGRTGEATGIDDKAHAFEVNEFYMLFSQRASGATEEIICHLVDMLNQAFHAYCDYHIKQGLPYRDNYLNEVIQANLDQITQGAPAATNDAAGGQSYEQAKANTPADPNITF